MRSTYEQVVGSTHVATDALLEDYMDMMCEYWKWFCRGTVRLVDTGSWEEVIRTTGKMSIRLCTLRDCVVCSWTYDVALQDGNPRLCGFFDRLMFMGRVVEMIERYARAKYREEWC